MTPLIRHHLAPVDVFLQLFARDLPMLRAQNPVVLESIAGCHPQTPHVDSPSVIGSRRFRSKDANDVVPLSALIAVQAGTTVLVWPGSHREVQHSSDAAWDRCAMWGGRVEIPPSGCLLFRQDLVHAGDGFLEHNIRCHLYLDDEKAPRRNPAGEHLGLKDPQLYRMKPGTL